jgi:hypothetical protein
MKNVIWLFYSMVGWNLVVSFVFDHLIQICTSTCSLVKCFVDY